MSQSKRGRQANARCWDAKMGWDCEGPRPRRTSVEWVALVFGSRNYSLLRLESRDLCQVQRRS